MNQIDQDELRDRVEEALKIEKRNARLTFFGVNLFLFVVFNLIAWGAVLTNPDLLKALGSSPSPLMTAMLLPLIGWGMAVGLSGAAAAMDFRRGGRQMREKAIARALAEQLFEAERSEKAKKRPAGEAEPLVLSDDGELIPAAQADQRRSSGSRSA